MARRFSSVLVVGGAVALMAAQATASGAASSPHVIKQPGPVTVTVSNAFFRIVIDNTDTDLGPFAGTMTGTVDELGEMLFAKADISFTSFDQDFLGPATIHAVPNGDWTGNIDPDTGQIVFIGTFSMLATVPSEGLDECPIGPSIFNLAGTDYDSATGAGSVEGLYLMNEVPPGIYEGCGGNESTVNLALGLPAAGSFTLDVIMQPPPTATHDVLGPVTFTSTTTTTAEPGETIASNGTLPRTGSRTRPAAFVGLSHPRGRRRVTGTATSFSAP